MLRWADVMKIFVRNVKRRIYVGIKGFNLNSVYVKEEIKLIQPLSFAICMFL